MKKIIIVILAMVMIFAACTKIDLKKPPQITPVVSNGIEDGRVEIVDASEVFGDLDNENIKVTKNEDGSLTYSIPKATHKKMMANMREEFDKMAEQDIASDEKVSDVELVDDYDFFEALAILADETSDAGYYDVTVTYNNDGSINYKIPKSTREEILADMREEFDKVIEDIKDTSILGVEHDESFKEITVLVERDKYRKSFDGFKIYSLVFTGMYYQSLDGVRNEDMKVIINVKDQSTGKVIDTIIYPDKFKKFAENCKELADGVVEFAKDTAELFSSGDDWHFIYRDKSPY